MSNMTIDDATTTRLRAELQSLNDRIRDSENVLIQFKVSGPEGSAVERVNLIQLRSERTRAEMRLSNRLRVLQGKVRVEFVTP